MQLTPAGGTSVRARLRTAACVLLAAGAPALAHAQAPAADPRWQFDGTGLLYSEKSRTTIFEPVASITRLFTGGTRLSARLSLDAMTGASPSGAQASNKVQTVTSASGNTSTQSATDVPTKPFHDTRGAVDLAWDQPIGSLLTLSTGGHASRERHVNGAHVRGDAMRTRVERKNVQPDRRGVGRDDCELLDRIYNPHKPVGGRHEPGPAASQRQFRRSWPALRDRFFGIK